MAGANGPGGGWPKNEQYVHILSDHFSKELAGSTR